MCIVCGLLDHSTDRHEVCLDANVFYHEASSYTKNLLFNMTREDVESTRPGVLRPLNCFRVLLFISHRWERSEQHETDPEGRQHNEVKRFLYDLWKHALSYTDAECLVYPENRHSIFSWAKFCAKNSISF